MDILYSEYLPALMSFLITLVWFCIAVTIRDEPPLLFIWGTMVCVVLGGGSVFLLPPTIAWFIFGGQVMFSMALVMWYKREKSGVTQQPVRRMRAREQTDIDALSDRMAYK